MNKKNISLFTAFSLLLFFNKAQAQDLSVLEARLDSVIEENMESSHTPGLAYVLVKDGEIVLKRGYGFTTLGEEIEYVNPDSTIFRIGSVTKTFTALALLQLVEEGKIDLHEDVNGYLTSVQVPKSYKRPITPHHLLTHTAGFDEINGRRVFSEDELIPLNDFLENRLRRVREPGEFISYSTYSIALAGLLVEEITGTDLESYMKSNIWEPLGMSMTSINPPDNHQPFIAEGYELRNGVNISQPWEWYHTFPASSINSTVIDMAKYMLMLLNNGTWNNATVLSSKMASAMKSKQAKIHPEVEGFAYGFYEDFVSGLTAYSHGGDMLGYSGYLSLVPELDLGIYVVHHHEGSRLRFNVLSTVMDFFGSLGEEHVDGYESRMKSNLNKFAGNYRWSTYCHSCTNSWIPDIEELRVNEDFTLSGFGRVFYQVSPNLFKSRDGLRTMGFKEEEDGSIKYMSLGNTNTFERVDE